MPNETDMNALSDSIIVAPPLPFPILPEDLPEGMEKLTLLEKCSGSPPLIPPKLPPKLMPEIYT